MRVPYNPVPEERPSNIAIPNVRIDTPAAAFGGASAAALERFGGQVERSASMLFDRAMELQKLKNDADAKEAGAAYSIEAGKLYAEYGSLQGGKAVEALPQYIETLKNTRQRIRDSLPNDFARRQFDSQSLSVLTWNVSAWSRYAAGEGKKYAVQASDARIESLRDQTLVAPEDELLYKRAVAETVKEVNQQAELFGWSPDLKNQNLSERISTLTTKRIEGLAKRAPFLAKDVLDKAIARGEIRGEDIARATNLVRQQAFSVGAKNTAKEIDMGVDNPGKVSVSLPSARAAIGKVEGSNDYTSLGIEVFDKNGASRGRALGKYGIMPENLPAWLKEAGLPQMTPQEFLKNAVAQDKVFDTVFGRYMRQYGSFDEAASRWFTGRSIADATARNVKDGNNINIQEYLRRANKALAEASPLSERLERGRALAQKLMPDEPLFEDYVGRQIQSDFNQDKAAKRDDALNNKLMIDAGLLPDQSGMVPKSLQELFARDPQIEEAWSRIAPAQQRAYLNVLANNAKGNVDWTPARQARSMELRGMAVTDPTGFLNLDMMSEDLPWGEKRWLFNRQIALRKVPEADPQVNRALSLLRSDLSAAGIRPDKKKDYQRFVGALQDALVDWRADKKKNPSPEEIRAIGLRLMQEQSSWLFGINKTRKYQVSAPSDEAAKIRQDPMWQRMEIIPDEETVNREYVRREYQKLYGRRPSSNTPQRGAPQVPMSR